MDWLLYVAVLFALSMIEIMWSSFLEDMLYQSDIVACYSHDKVQGGGCSYTYGGGERIWCV